MKLTGERKVQLFRSKIKETVVKKKFFQYVLALYLFIYLVHLLYIAVTVYKIGGCWAFAAVGAVEGLNKIKTGELVSLSEQELLDCDRGGDSGNFGCLGGNAADAFEFIIENSGIVTDKVYPYTENDTAACKAIEVCVTTILKFSLSFQFGKLYLVSMVQMVTTRYVTIDSYEDAPHNDEMSLKKAVAHQPISVMVEAENMKLYKSVILPTHYVTKKLDFS